MVRLTPLCKIAYKYGTDKCPQIRHHYTPMYYELLKDKTESFRRVVELGIGSKQNMQYTPEHYQNGASLLMWREFFPNSFVWGWDYDKSTMIESERIRTLLVDQRKEKELLGALQIVGTNVDLFIDDGLHKESSQIKTAKLLLPWFKKEIIYVIEDVKRPEEIVKELPEYCCQALISNKPINNGKKEIYEHLVVVRKV